VIPAADLRPLLHATTGLFALLLGVLPRALDLTGAALGLLAGFVGIPLSGLERRLRRPGEPWLCGLRTYPVAVALLVVFLPDATAASAWSILAFGDAAASVVGRRVPAPRLLGHPKATWAGTLALVVTGTVAGTLVPALVAATGGSAAPPAHAVLLAALAAGAADLLPVPPDDNLPIALAAGGVLAAATGVPLALRGV
jgi:dolichol kinase